MPRARSRAARPALEDAGQRRTPATPPAIRRAVPSETQASALTALARRAKASWGYPEDWIRLWTVDLTLTPQYLAAHDTFLAEIGGRLVGICALEDTAKGWWIEHLWVDPTAHRQGIGRALVRRALAEASRRRRADVRVCADPHAEAFYRSLGAEPDGAVPAPMPGAPDRSLPVLRFRADRLP